MKSTGFCWKCARATLSQNDWFDFTINLFNSDEWLGFGLGGILGGNDTKWESSGKDLGKVFIDKDLDPSQLLRMVVFLSQVIQKPKLQEDCNEWVWFSESTAQCETMGTLKATLNWIMNNETTYRLNNVESIHEWKYVTGVAMASPLFNKGINKGMEISINSLSRN